MPKPHASTAFTYQRVQHQASPAGGGVEELSERDERDILFVEQLHQFGESGKGSREAVDLSNHEHVDLFGGHLIQQSLKGRAVQRGSREAVVQEWAGVSFQPSWDWHLNLPININLQGFAFLPYDSSSVRQPC